MPKYFITDNSITEGYIRIGGNEYDHISKVLRSRKGDKLTASDGKGTDYDCVIEDVSGGIVLAKILSKMQNESEPKTKITIFQGLPKSDKMELIITKCVELGVTAIAPVVTLRTISKPDGKEEKKQVRLQKISEAAAMQSGRGIIPEIYPIINLRQAIGIAKGFDMSIVAYENEKIFTLKEALKGFNGKTLGVFIGPEGGFDDDEINIMVENGIRPITLGNRILRTETAGLAVTAMILYEIEG